MRVYSSDDRKYGGEEYDFLDIKLQIFYDCCMKIGLPREQYHNASFVMLKGRASEFYNNEIAGKGWSLNQILRIIKDHFETY